MGTRNRQRRAEKRRRHERRSSPTSNPRVDGPPVRDVIYTAARAFGPVGSAQTQALLAVLAEAMPGAAVELDVVLGEAVRTAWSRNWDAVEVTRQVGRRLGDRHARYVTDVIGRDAGGTRWWPSGQTHLDHWAAREGVSTIDAMACAIDVLGLLWRLPTLPRLGDGRLPGLPPARPDTRILEKVRALLAKAESTTFPDEAEALSAKAQELIARHSIDEAMVGAAEGAQDTPSGVRLPVDEPYAATKSVLLAVVASTNHCRAVWSKDLAFSTVVGFESDLAFVEVLYTSLLVQATSAMVAAGSQIDRSGRSRTRSFRSSFLLAYADRIGVRLREAETAGRVAAAERYGVSLVPVLAGRSDAVQAACDGAFPSVVSRSMSASNAAGWAAGRAAADLASLSGRVEVRSRSDEETRT
ncbi:MAG: DUF2786 domain-containing protein [Acidimicrobiales bacterium]